MLIILGEASMLQLKFITTLASTLIKCYQQPTLATISSLERFLSCLTKTTHIYYKITEILRFFIRSGLAECISCLKE
jgi:hypothetical protein